jgi:hypothetical protein
VKRPVVGFVATVATVDHDVPSRCSCTVRPDAAGESTPERTTVSAGVADAGASVRDTVEATAAWADEAAPSGDTRARMAVNTTQSR